MSTTVRAACRAPPTPQAPVCGIAPATIRLASDGLSESRPPGPHPRSPAPWAAPRHRVGADGKTPNQRARGTQTIPTLLGFGEVCYYKKRSQEPGIGSAGPVWSTGIWLGIERRTGQVIVFDKTMGG